jgi:hypothetical protein
MGDAAIGVPHHATSRLTMWNECSTNGELVSDLNAGIGLNLVAATNLDAATTTTTTASSGGHCIQ